MPPATMPAAAPAAAVPVHTPRALRRASGRVNAVVSTLSVEGASSAPPMPWTVRAAMSQPPLGARPPRMLKSVNTLSPASITRRWPIRSAARAPSRRKPAKVRV